MEADIVYPTLLAAARALKPQHHPARLVRRQVTVVLTSPAAAFSAADIEALLITSADAVCARLEALSRRQFDLATRAYQLLVADTGDGDEREDEGHGGQPRPGRTFRGDRP
jgi:hypothetical protein